MRGPEEDGSPGRENECGGVGGDDEWVPHVNLVGTDDLYTDGQDI